MSDFPNNVIQKMISDHTWWNGKKIPFYQGLNKRSFFASFYTQVKEKNVHRAVVLMGQRRIGKTVLMYQAIEKLIKEGVPAGKIYYFSLDTPVYQNFSPADLIEMALQQNRAKIKDCYIFFDEIQYLKDWEVHLKSLVDSNRNTKFIASGSAAAALKMKSNESGAGRFTDFFLPPLTFSEFIELNGKKNLFTKSNTEVNGFDEFFIAKNIKELNEQFLNYIRYGGFPEIALSKKKVDFPELLIQKDITEKVLMKDLPGLFGIENTRELQQFFTVLAYRTGEILSYGNISNETNTDAKTLRKYLEYLESSYLIKTLHRVDVTAQRFKNISQFKLHLTNPSLFGGLFGTIQMTDERFPHLVESAVFSQFPVSQHPWLRYANWKRNDSEGEVDLIKLNPTFQKANLVLEIKWSDKPDPQKLIYFLKKNNIEKGLITSKTIFKVSDNITIIPNSVLAYNISKQENGL